MADEDDPLEVAATAVRLRALHDREVFDAGQLATLLRRASAGPDADGWRTLLDRLSLALGAGLLVAGVIYFFAGNWAELPGLAKIGGVAALLAASGGWAYSAADRNSGRVALTAAAGLVGALFAVYGQVYQTGADAWTLFATWAALLVPWVLASRYEPLMLLWLVVGALALHLAVDQRAVYITGDEEVYQALLVGVVPAIAWFVSEVLPEPRRPARWFVRVLGCAVFVVLTFALFVMIVDGDDAPTAWLIAGPGSIVAGAWTLGLRGGRPLDLLLASAALTSAVVIATTALGRAFFSSMDLREGGFFLLAFLVIAQVGAAAWWLRRQWQKGAT